MTDSKDSLKTNTAGEDEIKRFTQSGQILSNTKESDLRQMSGNKTPTSLVNDVFSIGKQSNDGTSNFQNVNPKGQVSDVTQSNERNSTPQISKSNVAENQINSKKQDKVYKKDVSGLSSGKKKDVLEKPHIPSEQVDMMPQSMYSALQQRAHNVLKMISEKKATETPPPCSGNECSIIFTPADDGNQTLTKETPPCDENACNIISTPTKKESQTIIKQLETKKKSHEIIDTDTLNNVTTKSSATLSKTPNKTETEVVSKTDLTPKLSYSIEPKQYTESITKKQSAQVSKSSMNQKSSRVTEPAGEVGVTKDLKDHTSKASTNPKLSNKESSLGAASVTKEQNDYVTKTSIKPKISSVDPSTEIVKGITKRPSGLESKMDCITPKVIGKSVEKINSMSKKQSESVPKTESLAPKVSVTVEPLLDAVKSRTKKQNENESKADSVVSKVSVPVKPPVEVVKSVTQKQNENDSKADSIIPKVSVSVKPPVEVSKSMTQKQNETKTDNIDPKVSVSVKPPVEVLKSMAQKQNESKADNIVSKVSLSVKPPAEVENNVTRKQNENELKADCITSKVSANIQPLVEQVKSVTKEESDHDECKNDSSALKVSVSPDPPIGLVKSVDKKQGEHELKTDAVAVDENERKSVTKEQNELKYKILIPEISHTVEPLVEAVKTVTSEHNERESKTVITEPVPFELPIEVLKPTDKELIEPESKINSTALKTSVVETPAEEVKSGIKKQSEHKTDSIIPKISITEPMEENATHKTDETALHVSESIQSGRSTLQCTTDYSVKSSVFDNKFLANEGEKQCLENTLRQTCPGKLSKQCSLNIDSKRCQNIAKTDIVEDKLNKKESVVKELTQIIDSSEMPEKLTRKGEQISQLFKQKLLLKLEVNGDLDENSATLAGETAVKFAKWMEDILKEIDTRKEKLTEQRVEGLQNEITKDDYNSIESTKENLSPSEKDEIIKIQEVSDTELFDKYGLHLLSESKNELFQFVGPDSVPVEVRHLTGVESKKVMIVKKKTSNSQWSNWVIEVGTEVTLDTVSVSDNEPKVVKNEECNKEKEKKENDGEWNLTKIAWEQWKPDIFKQKFNYKIPVLKNQCKIKESDLGIEYPSYPSFIPAGTFGPGSVFDDSIPLPTPQSEPTS